MPRIRTATSISPRVPQRTIRSPRLMMRAVLLRRMRGSNCSGCGTVKPRARIWRCCAIFSSPYRGLFFFRASLHTMYAMLKLITAWSLAESSTTGFRAGVMTVAQEISHWEQIRRMQATIQADPNGVGAHAAQSVERVMEAGVQARERQPGHDHLRRGIGPRRILTRALVIMFKLIGRTDNHSKLRREKTDAKLGRYTAFLWSTMNLLGVACAVDSTWRSIFLARSGDRSRRPLSDPRAVVNPLTPETRRPPGQPRVAR